MPHLDALLAEFMEYNMITVGLVIGVLSVLFKNSKVIQWLKDKVKL
jgi:hypothetical protein